MTGDLAGVEFVLDSNVVSELTRREPDARVMLWLDGRPASSLAIAATTIQEIRYGLERLDPGKRREALFAQFEGLKRDLFESRVIAYGEREAETCARIMAKKRSIGESLDNHLNDAMIAACALTAGLAVATRNENEFRNTGVKIVNPWRARR